MSFLWICEKSESIAVCCYAYFALLWYWIAMPCYAILMIVLVKNRKKDDLKAPFFKLLFSLGVIDIISLTNLYLGDKMLYVFGWIWVHDVYRFLGSYAFKVYNLLAFLTGFAQGFHVLAIAVNRMAAMAIPFKHKSTWGGQRVTWITTGCWTLAVIIAGPILSPLIQIELVESHNGTRVHDSWSGMQLTIYMLCTALCGIIVITLLIILYSIGFCAAYKCYKEQKMLEGTDNDGKEKLSQGFRMALAGFLVSAPLLVQMTCMVVWRVAAMFGMNWNNFWYVSYGLASDMFGGLNPFVIVILSKRVIRKYVKEMLGLNGNQVTQVDLMHRRQ